MRVLILTSKAPLPGVSKTRLASAAGWSADEVALLADAFLRDTLSTCRRLPATRLWLHFAPPSERAYFAALDRDAQLLPQVEGDLGARLRQAFAAAFEAGAERVVLMGSDTPHVRREAIEDAFACLERAPGVLGPSEDGGYYLIGLRERRDELFEAIAWSTPRVAEQTRERARRCAWELATVEGSFDVDGLAELERLGELLEHDPARAACTARVLRTLGFRKS